MPEKGLDRETFMQIGTDITSRFSGGRRITSLHETMQQRAEAFSGLPEGVTRWQVLRLVKQAGKRFHLAPSSLRFLEILIEHTQDQDWQAGSRPIVYSTQMRLARRLGLKTAKQVRNLERQLHGCGMLTWNDTGNHRRYGYRHELTGKIVEAYGIDLSPLAVLYPVLQELAAEAEAEEQAWQKAKNLVSRLKRQIKGRLAEALNHKLPGAVALAMHYDEMAADTWRVDASSELDELKTIASSLSIMLEKVKEMLSHAEDNTPSNAALIGDENKEISSTGEDLLPPNTTIQHFTPSIEGFCNPPPVDIQNKRSAANAPQASRYMVGCADTGKSARQWGQGEIEGQKRLFAADETPQDVTEMTFLIQGTGIDKLQPEEIVQVAGRGFCMALPERLLEYTWQDIVRAGAGTAELFGISTAAWEEAGRTIGYEAAAVCVMLADARLNDPLEPVRNPGGFLRGCVKKARIGQLNLHSSVNYLLAKRKFHA